MNLYRIKQKNAPRNKCYITEDGIGDNGCKYDSLKLPRCIARDIVAYWNEEGGSENYVIEKVMEKS